MRIPQQKKAEIALTALAVPLLGIGTDLVVRGPLLASAGAALALTYASGALLSLLVWGLAMETARHPRRLMRIPRARSQDRPWPDEVPPAEPRRGCRAHQPP